MAEEATETGGVMDAAGAARSAGARKRIVVKIGTNTLNGRLDRPDPWYMAAMAEEMCDLVDEGHSVILVTSGAIGTGRKMLGLKERPRDVRLRQACAAVGQAHLMQNWSSAFARRGRNVGQVLLTYHTFGQRESYLHMREAMLQLLKMGIVPIVNENDCVSIAEIDTGFGDNDRLSALVATKLEADLLVILSDVKGLYTKPPDVPGAQLVPEVREVTDEVRAMAGVKTSSGGRGGMKSKLDAAQLAMENGTPVVIAPGREPHVLRRILSGEAGLGTRFTPRSRRSGARRWLMVARPEGEVHVDEGAAKALREGRNLLPTGVTRVVGSFDVESVVELVADGRVVGRAVSELSSADLHRVLGLHTPEAQAALGIDAPVNVTRKGHVLLFDEKP